MGNRTQDGFYDNQFGVMVLSGATALGTTDTAIINFPNIAVDGVVGLTNDFTTAVTTAAAGTIVTLDQPGLYSIELYCGLAGAGVLNGGVSIGGTIATFNQSPIDIATSPTSAYAAVDGNQTLATNNQLINISILRRFTRAQINGVANLIRFAATVGVTLDANNSLARIQYLGRTGQY